MCHSCKEELAQPAPDTPSAELLYPPTLHASIRPQAYELERSARGIRLQPHLPLPLTKTRVFSSYAMRFSLHPYESAEI